MIVLTKSEMFDLLSDNLAMFECQMDTGVINWTTAALERLFGYKVPGDLEGRPVEVLMPDAIRDKHATVHRSAYTANPEARMMGAQLVLRGQRLDGTTFPVEVMLLPKAANRTRVVVGVVFDMSNRFIAPATSATAVTTTVTTTAADGATTPLPVPGP